MWPIRCWCYLEELESPTMEALKYLWNQSNLLYDIRKEEKARNLGFSGKVYFDGIKLSELAHEIAHKLRDRGLINPEEIALKIRVKALLQVQIHYHYIIGPAMLEHTDVLERIGRSEEAISNYECIIDDFSWFLDEYVDTEDFDIEDKYVTGSFESLYTALNLRLNHELPLLEKQNIEEKIKKIRTLLGDRVSWCTKL